MSSGRRPYQSIEAHARGQVEREESEAEVHQVVDHDRPGGAAVGRGLTLTGRGHRDRAEGDEQRRDEQQHATAGHTARHRLEESALLGRARAPGARDA